MSNSSTSQLLGATAVIGGVAILPMTAGSPWLSMLTLAIKISCTAVLVSLISLKIALWWYRKRKGQKKSATGMITTG